jgi:hypothetical protein
MVRAESSNGGTFIASEDHVAEVELLKAEAETYRAMVRKYAQNVQALLNERRRGDASTIQDLMEPKRWTLRQETVEEEPKP